MGVVGPTPLGLWMESRDGVLQARGQHIRRRACTILSHGRRQPSCAGLAPPSPRLPLMSFLLSSSGCCHTGGCNRGVCPCSPRSGRHQGRERYVPARREDQDQEQVHTHPHSLASPHPSHSPRPAQHTHPCVAPSRSKPSRTTPQGALGQHLAPVPLAKRHGPRGLPWGSVPGADSVASVVSSRSPRELQEHRDRPPPYIPQSPPPLSIPTSPPSPPHAHPNHCASAPPCKPLAYAPRPPPSPPTDTYPSSDTPCLPSPGPPRDDA